jgi:hypothetical protein
VFCQDFGGLLPNPCTLEANPSDFDDFVPSIAVIAERNQSDVLRQLIRNLAVFGALKPTDTLGQSMSPDADFLSTAGL